MQEAGTAAKTIEDKADELAALPDVFLTDEERETIARTGDNRGCMPLKGANRGHNTAPEADHWGMTNDLEAVAKRWGINPDQDLVLKHAI
jgi:hypothetical protein